MKPINFVEIGLRTRDIVRLWHHGTRRFLSFIGRESGYVKILGELIHLAPLQARLEELALMSGWPSMPVVAALPSERREAELVLVAAGTTRTQAEMLLEKFNAVTEPLCQLSHVIELTSIPRTNLGKVDSEALQTLLRDRA